MNKTMHLNLASSIESSDAGRRLISGVVLPFNTIGNTSAGPVIFESGSVEIPDAKRIKLLAMHSKNDPIGRAQSFTTTQDAIYGTFKISASSRGTDYLTLAAEDLISALSIGVDVLKAKENEEGILVISSARMTEVSLVESPAYAEAIVTKVAANEAEEVPTPTPTESEAILDVKAPEPTETPAEAATPVVEASRPIITTPYNALNSQTVRHGITSKGAYTMHKIKAQLGNDESKLWVTAAEDMSLTAADGFASAGIGFNPTQYMASIVSTQGNFGRPAMETVSRATLPPSGLTINRPKFTTYPTVTVEAESGAVSETDAVSEYLSATVSKYSGMQTISIELLERSDPGFFDAVTTELQNNYNKVTEAALIAFLTAQGTQSSAQAATSAGLIAFATESAPAAYLATSYFAKNYLCGSSQWGLLLGAVDTTGRPIYNAANPMNAGGNVAPSSVKGNFLGLDLFVSRNVVSTTIDESAFVITPEAITVFESPTAYMSVNVVANLQIQVAIYGYLALMANVGAGVRRYNLT